MKRRLFPLLLCAMFIFSACSSPAYTNGAAQSSTQPSVFENPDMGIMADTDVSKKAELPQPDISIERARKQYAELYETSHMFTDMYMVEKAWLIGKENIVQLISIAGFNDVSILTRESIERIEQASFSNFASVTIFDKTGDSISLMVYPEELLAITELLK